MKTSRRTFCLVALMSLLGACATPGSKTSDHLTAVAEGQEVLTPAPGKALVILMRPSQLGFLVQATVFDGTDYVATVSALTRVAYQATPGKHVFMVVSEAADFMEADLKAGQTYIALVTPRMGAWRARFSLRPLEGNEREKLEEWFTQGRPYTANARGAKWAEANKADTQAKQAEYLPKWQAKGDADKPRLTQPDSLPASAVRAAPRAAAPVSTASAGTSAMYPRRLNASEVSAHFQRHKSFKANSKGKDFSMFVRGGRYFERNCPSCEVAVEMTRFTVRAGDGQVCMRWERVTFPDSGCFTLEQKSETAFVLKGANNEAAIDLTVAP